MTTATSTKVHYSPILGHYARCVAKGQCEYGDAHTSPAGIAEGGGGVVKTHGHSQLLTISPLVDDTYSMGTKDRRQTWKRVGNDFVKLTPSEAARWRADIAKRAEDEPVQTRLDPTLLPSLGWGETAPRAKPAGRQTNPKDFVLAEHSTDPGILAQLAHSADWSVRLLVARNPNTAIDTVESLAVSTDKNAHLYRNAAHVELGFRYQDLRDEAELKACARMEANGALQKTFEQMPSYRQLAYMPAKRWEQKSARARRTLVQAALTESAKVLKLSVKFSGWTLRKTAQIVIGKDGMRLIKLPVSVALYRSTRDVAGFIVGTLAAIAGDEKAQRRISKRFGFA